MDKLGEISQAFVLHYSDKIKTYGPTARGLDWGAEDDVQLRYGKMLEIIRNDTSGRVPRLLDVGCGYGGLLAHAEAHGIACDYTGIDIVADTIDHARSLHPKSEFLTGDLLQWDFGERRFDYVVCSGILTLKLRASILDMHTYFQALVRAMFSLCDEGIAFNVMSNCVNFTAPNLYYRSPVEVLAFCLAEMSTKVRIDQSYPLYEFTTYVYRDGRA